MVPNEQAVMEINFKLLSAGYCEASESHTLSGKPRKKIKFFATFGLLLHPTHGAILFDSGYTARFYKETASFPGSLYARMTKVTISEEREAKTVLKSEGISPEEVKFIIISHFHADHIGGLRDFPNATFICSTTCWNGVKNLNGFSAVRKGFLRNLLPSNFTDRLRLIDFDESLVSDPTLGALIDIFNDGSVLACQLHGHAAGQIGILFKTQKARFFLVADGAWSKHNYQRLHLPSPLVRLFFDSWSDFKVSLQKIHRFYMTNPDTVIIPCHCEETYIKYGE